MLLRLIIENAWICLNIHGSEYARVHNIPNIVHKLRSL